MLNNLSTKSRNSINVSIVIWFTMFFAQCIYIFVCYILLEEGLHEAILDPKILEKILFLNVNIHASLYILSILILFFGYQYYQKSYSKLVINTQEKRFKDVEEEFKYFNEKYLTLMFVCLAIFESIVILGIIVFLTTLNLSTTLNLILIAMAGFLLVIPNKNKFNYTRT